MSRVATDGLSQELVQPTNHSFHPDKPQVINIMVAEYGEVMMMMISLSIKSASLLFPPRLPSKGEFRLTPPPSQFRAAVKNGHFVSDIIIMSGIAIAESSGAALPGFLGFGIAGSKSSCMQPGSAVPITVNGTC